MSFGNLIRNLRNNKYWDLTDLAARANVSTSTISRIELASSSPTLETTIHLMNALEISCPDLYQAVFSKTPPAEAITPSSQEDPGAPTLDDIIEFNSFLADNPDSGLKLLSNWLNAIYCDISGKAQEKFTPAFPPDAITLLVSDSPLHDARLKYPLTMEPEVLRRIYQQGGVIIPQDIYAYAKSAFQSAGEEGKASLYWKKHRLKPGNSVKKLKFSDLTELNKYAQADELFFMGLKAAQFETVFDLWRPVFPQYGPFASSKKWPPELNGQWACLFMLLRRWQAHRQITIKNWRDEAQELQ